MTGAWANAPDRPEQPIMKAKLTANWRRNFIDYNLMILYYIDEFFG
jgi:hypothetical protein